MTRQDLILGTAGHIDHGKTSLVRALTGVDTDRLPEEKRRGITIELGFAELVVGDFRLGIVDVPGHERFVRNMLCGATGMDLALVVVAANESIKPQTREHFEILQLLGVRHGLIVVTKADLIDDAWRVMVAAEVREWSRGTFLEGVPLVFTSVETGEGLDTLREQLEVVAARAAVERESAGTGPFRLPIDRSFSIAGHGTVVTGSVTHGLCHVGDVLEVQPGGLEVRVRGLRNHDRVVEEVRRGLRAAVNVVGVHHDLLGRGQELCTVGALRSSKCVTAEVRVLPSAARSLPDRARVKLHVGTAEVGAVVRLLRRPLIAPGESDLAQLFLAAPVAVSWGQPLILRNESPVATWGGGRVLVPDSPRIRRKDVATVAMLEGLAAADPAVRAAAAAYLAGFAPWEPTALSRTAGVADGNGMVDRLLEQGELVAITNAARRRLLVHRQQLDVLRERVVKTLGKLHARNPLQPVFQTTALAAGFRYAGDEAVLARVLDELHSRGKIRRDERGVALTGLGPRLSPHETQILRELLTEFQSAGMQPPTTKELQQRHPRWQTLVPSLLKVAAENGQLTEFGAGLYLWSDCDRQSRELVRAALTGGRGLTLSQIRELLQTTRKYAVPYCEFLDRIRVTVRRGDLRYAGPS